MVMKSYLSISIASQFISSMFLLTAFVNLLFTCMYIGRGFDPRAHSVVQLQTEKGLGG